jgi:hypothetical protein
VSQGYSVCCCYLSYLLTSSPNNVLGLISQLGFNLISPNSYFIGWPSGGNDTLSMGRKEGRMMDILENMVILMFTAGDWV